MTDLTPAQIANLLELCDRMEKESADIDDPMCSFFEAVGLLRDGAQAIRFLLAAEEVSK